MRKTPTATRRAATRLLVIAADFNGQQATEATARWPAALIVGKFLKRKVAVRVDTNIGGDAE